MSDAIDNGVGPAPTQLISEGYTIVSATHREMRAISMQSKRDIDDVLRRVLYEIGRVPEWAANGYYNRPIGDGKNVVGASVTLTRIVARNWGNCSVRSHLIGVTGDEGNETY